MRILLTMLAAAFVFTVFLNSAMARPVEPICEKVLPIAEVNKAYTKKKIVLFGQQEQHWAVATCNYGHEDDKKSALTLTIDPYISDDLYNKTYKSNPVFTDNRKPIKGFLQTSLSNGQSRSSSGINEKAGLDLM
ncbi:MAG: hypothetical protein HY026_05865 [Deltaproteobacteria bacterium]|nr:hypothetical protein [Deltaproteobacteria bacterium]